MNNQTSIPSPQHTVLEQVREGMHVHDQNNDHIGHVKFVYFGSDAGTTEAHSVGTATAPSPAVTGTNLVTDVAQAVFGDDDLPETFRARLTNSGYVRINSEGLLSSDRYALREQIANVSGDVVHLNVTRDELIKR